MKRTGRRGTRWQAAALALGAAAVLLGGIITAGFWLGNLAGEVWSGILTKTATRTSHETQPLPSGSVVLYEGMIVGRLDSVRTYQLRSFTTTEALRPSGI